MNISNSAYGFRSSNSNYTKIKTLKATKNTLKYSNYICQVFDGNNKSPGEIFSYKYPFKKPPVYSQVWGNGSMQYENTALQHHQVPMAILLQLLVTKRE